MANVHFLTGYPEPIARALTLRLLQKDRRARVRVLVQPRFATEARQELLDLPPRQASRVEVLIGDPTDMHLGLAGDEYRHLVEEVTHIFHLASLDDIEVDRGSLERANVEGTRNVLELGRDAKNLVRLAHLSTVHVSGDRQGVIEEEELEEGQHFHNAWEESRFRAEVLVRKSMAELPISVFRHPTLVGNSETGTIDRTDRPYYRAFQLVTSPIRTPLPLPGEGAFPLNVVPNDFVAQALAHLAFDAEAEGRTFHLVDPNPVSARKAWEHVARRSGRRLPPMKLPARASVALLRAPILERFVRPQRAALEHLHALVIYNCRNTLESLDGSGIHCPPLLSYLDRILETIEKQQMISRRSQRQTEAAIEDPLAPPPDESGDGAAEVQPSPSDGGA